MHPIIFLWSHPRSMSTAIERIMRERGDLHCLHEPFLRYYYQERSQRNLPMFNHEGNQPHSYEATRAMILSQAEKTPVFAKDMSYYIMPELLKDIDFFSQIRHCFLIRNPLRSILSYYKLDPGMELREIGIESQWLHYQKADQWGLKPIVIEAESVQANPEAVMELFWAELGLEYKHEALNWEQESIPEDWKFVEGWHQQASQSRGIKADTAAQKLLAKTAFAGAVHKTPHLRDYLEYHLPAYHALQEVTLCAH